MTYMGISVDTWWQIIMVAESLTITYYMVTTKAINIGVASIYRIKDQGVNRFEEAVASGDWRTAQIEALSLDLFWRSRKSK